MNTQNALLPRKHHILLLILFTILSMGFIILAVHWIPSAIHTDALVATGKTTTATVSSTTYGWDWAISGRNSTDREQQVNVQYEVGDQTLTAQTFVDFDLPIIGRELTVYYDANNAQDAVSIVHKQLASGQAIAMTSFAALSLIGTVLGFIVFVRKKPLFSL